MDKITRQRLTAFADGSSTRCQEVLGAHFEVRRGRKGVIFRVWAPRARSVSVVGEFNGWDRRKAPMKYLEEFDVWSVFVPELTQQYQAYKFSIEPQQGDVLLKSDPFARHFETAPGNASKLYRERGFRWADKRWMASRAARNPYHTAMNIYEVHPGAWRRFPDGNRLPYERLGEELARYAADMGYTHVALMGIPEHTDADTDGIFGYFAPSSRIGAPDAFKALVNALHKANVGVLLDWNAAYFPADEHGLALFDGAPLFEPEQPLRRGHGRWNAHAFEYGMPQVRSFLVSSALYWLEEYHVDGLRLPHLDAMLYLDYDRERWQPNLYGGAENLDAVELLRHLNTTVLTGQPGAVTVAGHSTAWQMVTKPPYAGGLGFSFAWNTDWSCRTLAYASLDFQFRTYNHDKLTLGAHDAFDENYILPLPHAEQGSQSLISKMPGTYEEQFAGLRALLGYMMSYPGKKLLFMGGELAQFSAWDGAGQLDWMLLGYESHRRFRDYVRALNEFYLENPPLWQIDDGRDGFRWIVSDDSGQNIIVFRRIDEKDDEIVAAVNFSQTTRENYRIGVKRAQGYRIVFSSDEKRFGGAGAVRRTAVRCEDVPSHGMQQSAVLRIPALSAVWLAPQRPEEKKKAAAKDRPRKKQADVPENAEP